MSELYNRIDRLCKERGTNVTALCRKAKVARAALSELNMGRTKTITLETAGKLAAALDISVDELMGTAQKEKAPAQKGERAVTDDDIKFALWGTREIDDDVLNQVKSFAKFARENRKDK